MDWVACVAKLGSWGLISQHNRWGFVFGVLGNSLFAYSAYQIEMWGLAVYCCCVSVIQVRGWFNWRRNDTQ